MGSVSMGHWLIVLAVIVLFFGAKKIPELARGVGKGIKEFKNAVNEDDDIKELSDSEVVETKTKKTSKKA